MRLLAVHRKVCAIIIIILLWAASCATATLHHYLRSLFFFHPPHVYVHFAVQSLKAKIANLTGFHVDQQRLIFGGFILEGSRSLGYYNIRSEATVHLELRLDPST